MRLPRVRLSVRRMTAMIAVVAIGVWAWRLWRLSREYQELAVYHAYGAATAKHIMFVGPFREPGQRDGRPSRRELIYDYQSALKDKYLRAARRPWLPVAPDPPPPK